MLTMIVLNVGAEELGAHDVNGFGGRHAAENGVAGVDDETDFRQVKAVDDLGHAQQVLAGIAVLHADAHIMSPGNGRQADQGFAENRPARGRQRVGSLRGVDNDEGHAELGGVL